MKDLKGKDRLTVKIPTPTLALRSFGALWIGAEIEMEKRLRMTNNGGLFREELVEVIHGLVAFVGFAGGADGEVGLVSCVLQHFLSLCLLLQLLLPQQLWQRIHLEHLSYQNRIAGQMASGISLW